jgi:hypothetical protein
MGAPPDINDGAEWSEMDIADLKGAVAYGRSLKEVAELLCRSGTPLDRRRQGQGARTHLAARRHPRQ